MDIDAVLGDTTPINDIINDTLSNTHLHLKDLYNDIGFLNSSVLHVFINNIIEHLSIVIEEPMYHSDDQL